MNVMSLGKLGKRLLASLIVSSLIIIFLVISCIISIRYFLSVNIQGQQSLDRIDESVNLLYKSLIDQETGQRGYSLTNNETYLEPYQSGKKIFFESAEELIGQMESYPELKREVKGLIGHGQYWHSNFGEPLVVTTRNGEHPRSEMLNEGKRVFDEFRQIADHFTEHIEVHRSIVRDKMKTRINLTLLSLVLTIIAIIVLNVIINLKTLKSMIKPIIDLSHCVNAYAKHDFTKQIPSYHERDELSDLISNVDVMRLELAKSIDTLESKVNFDELTGLYNRRYFNEFMLKEWEAAKLNADRLSFLLLDIDYYKNYNDTYGHLAGDDCLKQLSEHLQQYNLDPLNFIARYGGEEFGILLLQRTAPEALKIAEEIRSAVVDLKIPHRSSPINECVTVSVGVATVFPKGNQMPNHLISIADEALYQSKQNGRNQVTQHTDEGKFLVATK